jgi:hypothetical protein
VSILENPGDSLEDAHPFPRCSPEQAKKPYNPQLRSLVSESNWPNLPKKC